MIGRLVLVAICAATAACKASPRDAASSSAGPAGSQQASAPVSPTTDDAIVKSAMSAAPHAVSAAATIVTVSDKMELRTVRAGTNGWTCFPDMASTPGVDPMCVDRNAMDWVMAWMQQTKPTAGKMGFGYMLVGGSDASNDDPFAATPKPGSQWVTTGPHVMVFNIGASFDGYPITAADTTVPYVMFPNTPYAHLMVPVR